MAPNIPIIQPLAPKLGAPDSGYTHLCLIDNAPNIVLSWGAPSFGAAVTEYQIEVFKISKTLSESNNPKVHHVGNTQLKFELLDICTEQATYRWRVRAIGQGDTLSAWSAERSIHVELVVAPTNPMPVASLVEPKDGAKIPCLDVVADAIILKWASTNDAYSSYEVQWRGQPSDREGSIQVAGLNSKLNVTCGASYQWRVRGLNTHGSYSAWTAWSGFLIQAGLAYDMPAARLLDPPSGTRLECAAGEHSAVGLLWRPIGGDVIDHYEVEITRLASPVADESTTTEAVASSQAQLMLEGRCEELAGYYRWRVKGVYHSGEWAWSAAHSFEMYQIGVQPSPIIAPVPTATATP